MCSTSLHICTVLLSLLAQSIVTTYSCGGSITGSGSGRITSPFYPQPYPRNANCEWTITTTVGRGMRLEIEDIDNKELSPSGSTGRCYDKLKIYQVVSSVSQIPIGNNLCGNSVAELPTRVFLVDANSSGTTVVRITFTSDYATQLKGFSISYEALCNETKHGSEGTVLSPGYPNLYPRYTRCLTRIVTPPGTKVYLTFMDFDLQTSNGCRDDYVTVTDAQEGSDYFTYLGESHRYCGSIAPPPITAPSNELTILFESDRGTNKKGFKAVWSAVIPTTTVTTAVATTNAATTVTTAVSTTNAATTVTTAVSTTNAATATTRNIDTSTKETTSTAIDTTRAIQSTVTHTTAQVLQTTSSFHPIPRPSKLATPYNGTCSTTVNGKTCQRWDVTTPHRPNFKPSLSNHNYCRIPDIDSVEWCYTTDPDTRWEYCDVTNCVLSSTAASTVHATTWSTAPTTAKTSPSATTSTMKMSTMHLTNLTTSTQKVSSNKPIPIGKESKESSSSNSELYPLLIGLGLLMIAIIVVVVWLVHRRRKKRANLMVDDVAFHQIPSREVDTDALERQRENTYVEIPFTSQDELALRNGCGSPPLPDRRCSRDSVDSVAAAKFEAAFQSSKGALLDSKSQRQEGALPPEEQAYSMADEGSESTVIENPYQQVEYQSAEDVIDKNSHQQNQDNPFADDVFIPDANMKSDEPSHYQSPTQIQSKIAAFKYDSLSNNCKQGLKSKDQKQSAPSYDVPFLNGFTGGDKHKKEKLSKLSLKVPISPLLIDNDEDEDQHSSDDGLYSYPASPVFNYEAADTLKSSVSEPKATSENANNSSTGNHAKSNKRESDYCLMDKPASPKDSRVDIGHDSSKKPASAKRGSCLYVEMDPQTEFNPHYENIAIGKSRKK